jgi:AcrR family transcriptional regulator
MQHKVAVADGQGDLPGSSRPGGRTARTRAAVLEAALEELSSRGYDQASVEAIAHRAGVHKTTLYRRWGGKEQLIADAIETAAADRIEVPDSGDVGQDLRVLARAVQSVLTSREGAATVRALVSGAQGTPEVQRIIRHFWTARVAHVGQPLVGRAIERGQLPGGTDPAELIGYVAAPLYYRLLITADPLTEATADQAAAAALAAARAGALNPL